MKTVELDEFTEEIVNDKKLLSETLNKVFKAIQEDMQKRDSYINDKFDKIDNNFKKVNGTLKSIDNRLNSLEKNLLNVDNSLNVVEYHLLDVINNTDVLSQNMEKLLKHFEIKPVKKVLIDSTSKK